MKKKINITEKASNCLIAEFTLDYKNTSTVSDENFLENAWQTAINKELVSRDDRSKYDIQVVEDETLNVDEELLDKQKQQKETELLIGLQDD